MEAIFLSAGNGTNEIVFTAVSSGVPVLAAAHAVRRTCVHRTLYMRTPNAVRAYGERCTSPFPSDGKDETMVRRCRCGIKTARKI